MRHGTRRNTKSSRDPVEQVARRLAARCAARSQDFRYVEVRFYDGEHWTIESYWERLVDGQWERMEWTETSL